MPMIPARLSELRRSVEDARRTDYRMPVWLPFLDIILFILLAPVIVLFATANLVAISALLVAALIIAAIIVDVYVVYKWVDRRNRHFERSHRMFRAALDVLEARGLPASGADAVLREMELEERYTSPVLWLLVLILTSPIPIVGGLVRLYFLHMLTRDFYRHSLREMWLAEKVASVLARGGSDAPSYMLRRLPDRNTILYAVLTIVTFGLFALYWVYVVTADPNSHFEDHARYDAELLAAVEKCAGERGAA